jgi:hypothetical protein
MIPKQALSALPEGLRKPLILEYQRIIQNYLERNWIASELSGGRFAEIVYTILDGYAAKAYPSKPHKPADMVAACKKLEKNMGVPRSFRILIPRLLPVLYEVRNNRDVGHVGGDVNSNFMDAAVVVAMVKWTLAELVRVFHQLSIREAQEITDGLSERILPVLWKHDKVIRVLNEKLAWKDQILLIASDAKVPVPLEEMMTHLDCKDKVYLKKVIRGLHDLRLLEFDAKQGDIKITPKGSQQAEKLIGVLAAQAPSTP